MSINGRNDSHTPVDNLRRNFDIQGEKLNQITANNREVRLIEKNILNQ